MKLWVCKDCGHEVLASERPQPIKWTDGHVCHFYEEKRPLGNLGNANRYMFKKEEKK